MTHAQQAFNAYASPSAATKSDRSLEYDVVARATSNLKAASSQTSAFSALAQAVDENRRMWSLIASSVGDSENRFPPELKAQLFYLYEFTLLHSRKILRGEADIHPLVDINMSILRGLKSSTAP